MRRATAARAPSRRRPSRSRWWPGRCAGCLATNVRVRQAKDKGKIEIEFHGEEELERIFRALTERLS